MGFERLWPKRVGVEAVYDGKRFRWTMEQSRGSQLSSFHANPKVDLGSALPLERSVLEK